MSPGKWDLLLVPIADYPDIPVIVKPRKRHVPLCEQPVNDYDPLAVFVAKCGGLNPDYAGGWREGEIRMIQEAKAGLPPGGINKHAPLTLEEMAGYAHAHGYIVEPCPNLLLQELLTDCEAARAKQAVKRVYSFAGRDSVLPALQEREYDKYNVDAN
jgi:hypothetical protein